MLLSGTVPLSADASDDIRVDRVLFYAGSQYLGYDSAAPYQLNCNTALYSDGTYAVTAHALDGSDQRVISAPATVVLNNFDPSVAVTAPSNGAVVSGSVTLQGSAQDGNGLVLVEILVDGTVLGSFTQEPYQVTWDTAALANGGYSIQVRAYDAAGRVGTSYSTWVSVRNDVPPTGSITSPAPQAVLRGTATFSVNARDAHGVDRVTFYVGTRYVTWDGTAPYSITLNTFNFSNGDYVLTARIFDSTGHMTVTEGVPVRIQN
jgi:hypothetical protein